MKYVVIAEPVSLCAGKAPTRRKQMTDGTNKALEVLGNRIAELERNLEWRESEIRTLKKDAEENTSHIIRLYAENSRLDKELDALKNSTAKA